MKDDERTLQLDLGLPRSSGRMSLALQHVAFSQEQSDAVPCSDSDVHQRALLTKQTDVLRPDHLKPCNPVQEQRTISSSIKSQLNTELQQLLDLPLSPWFRVPSILRFRQESQDQAEESGSACLPLEHRRDLPVLCEFCRERARPCLDINAPSHGADLEFCCSQYKQLFEDLVRERKHMLEDLGQGECRKPEVHPPGHLQEQDGRALAREECWQSVYMLDNDFQAANPSVLPADNYFPLIKTISYQLSSFVPREGGWTVLKDSGIELDPQRDDEDICIGPGVFGFGITHSKNNLQFMEKYYSSGKKFLTAFPDGSAQVFYPSGALAVLIATGESKKMVCIVQEDKISDQPIRALFQSNSKATCYHSNGNIWLSLNTSGGQYLDKRGAQMRKWRWTQHLHTPTPFRPLFLSLNNNVGVRILGQERIFVSFLAMGQQAKFSVGTCVQVKETGPALLGEKLSISTDKLFLLAGRVRIHRALGHLHHYLRFPINPQPPGIREHPSALSLATRLLGFSKSLKMEEKEKAFIIACLQDSL